MKKNIKLLVSFVIFCVLFAGCNKFFQYILIDDTASYTRLTFHEMYEQENIDVLFVGSSHCYRSFIPEILDKELGVNTFNCGTSSQHLDGSYMIIKEAARYNDIKHIYLEVYFNAAFAVNKERTDLTQTYIISDYLRPSLDKVQYLLNASTKEYYSNSFFRARRNWSRFFDADYIKDLVLKKGTAAYKNYEYTYVAQETEWYAGKGYVANNQTVENWNYFLDKELLAADFDTVSKDWLHALEDIIDFCDKKGIALTLVAAPMPNYLLAAIGNYDEYIGLIQDMIADTDIRYYDFNLCKEEYFPNTSFLFKDKDHLNCYGAEKFSQLFADFINGKIPEEDLFYDSYEEKIGQLLPTVFGIVYHDRSNDKGETTRKCQIVSTGNDSLEYKITLTPQEGKPYKLQGFSANKSFAVSPEEHGVITITYRLGNLPDEMQEVQVAY